MRPLEKRDEDIFVAFLTDPDFMQHSRAGALDESNARIAFTQRLKRSGDQFTKLAVIEKSSGDLIGYCGVEICELEGKQELELGYRLTQKARGRGYATEAARAVLNYYQQHGVTNIIAYTAPGNNLSQAVLKKLGFKAIKDSEIESFPIVVFHQQSCCHCRSVN